MPHAREDIPRHAHCRLDGWLALLPDKGDFLGDQLDLEPMAEQLFFHLRPWSTNLSRSGGSSSNTSSA